MKRIRFTEEQIIAVLREHEAGAKTADLARKGSQSRIGLSPDPTAQISLVAEALTFIDPVQKLRHAVDLVVMFAVRKHFDLRLKVPEPSRALRQLNLAGFDYGDRGQARLGEFSPAACRPTGGSRVSLRPTARSDIKGDPLTQLCALRLPTA